MDYVNLPRVTLCSTVRKFLICNGFQTPPQENRSLVRKANTEAISFPCSSQLRNLTNYQHSTSSLTHRKDKEILFGLSTMHRSTVEIKLLLPDGLISQTTTAKKDSLKSVKCTFQVAAI